MPQYYTVQQGDTLSSISQRLGISIDSLIAMNQLTNPDVLNVGQILVINAGNNNNVSETDPDPQAVEAQTSNMEFSFPGEGGSSTRVIDGLLYQISTNRNRYNAGQPVNITFTKTNIGSSPRRLSYNTGQRFDIEAVRSDGRVIWRWSAGRFFTQQSSEVVLRPGQRQVFRATWDQRNLQGNLVSSQNLTLRGVNVARGLRNRFVSTNIFIARGVSPTPAPTPAPTPRPGACRPGINLITNGGFEFWPNPNSAPRGWEGSNVSRESLIRRANIYSARLGTNPRVRARLSQTVPGSPGRIYRLSYWVREIGQVSARGNFIFRARVLFYNAAGQLIGTADPEYTEDFIPNNFIQLSFTTGRTPNGTRSMEVRFDFTPQSGNNNAVALDEIFIECLG